MRAKEMAPTLGTTPTYLPHVLGPLVAAGWLRSEPGPLGGYRLYADLENRSILELIELSEGEVGGEGCVLRGGPCRPGEPCAIHSSWVEARAALAEKLDQIPIVEKKRQGER